MLYCLRVSEAMGLEDDNKESSSSEDNRSDGSDSEDTEPDLQFADYKKLVKFNAEQKQRLKEMWGSL